MLGDAIFETVRVYEGSPFRLDAHLGRLRRSAEQLGIPVPLELDAEVAALLSEAIGGSPLNAGMGGVEQAEEAGNVRMRITLSRGVGAAHGLAVVPGGMPTLVLSLAPVSATGAAERSRGINAIWSESRRNEKSASAGHKTTAFLDSILELRRALELGAGECVFLDSSGHLSEASASNIFLYDGEALITPALGCGCLPGITRSVVMDLARELSIRVEERVVETEELEIATESFLTSSIREIVPLVQIGSRAVGDGVPGPVTLALQSRYRDKVAEECRSA
jgi:branched-subunit amino acid aminotransferase/4-amino-4-deoxychorismate lyase